MFSTTDESKILPPGQERPYPKHTSSGKIPFEYRKTGLKGETYYKVWGDVSDASKTPLICLHGGPGFTHPYILPICLVYADHGIPVLMYDQVGCGESTRFRDKKGDTSFWTPELFMAELENVMAHFQIKQFDLLGQSWGGMLAAQFTIERQPQGLRKLIIADSPADMGVWVKVANKLRKQLPQDVQDTLDRCERDGTTDSEEYEKCVMLFNSRHLCRLEPLPQELVACFDYLKDDNTVYETMCGPSEFFVIGNLKTWSIAKELSKITAKTCPGGMLIMNGHFDEAQDETMAPYFLQPSCRTKWVQFALSSHAPYLEETEKFIAVLGAFLVQE